jgi:hypothetical protein
VAAPRAICFLIAGNFAVRMVCLLAAVRYQGGNLHSTTIPILFLECFTVMTFRPPVLVARSLALPLCVAAAFRIHTKFPNHRAIPLICSGTSVLLSSCLLNYGESMTKKLKPLPLILLILNLTACSKPSQPPNPAPSPQPQANSAPATPTPPAESSAAPPPASARAVKTEMRNVLFHLTSRSAAHLETLSGELWPVGKNEMPVFDDKASFEVHVSAGKVSITPEALSEIMNSYVFARSDAPLKDISISIDKDRLIIKGKLHTKGDIPFGTAGRLSTTPDGRLRVQTEKITALKIPVKGMMGLFGIELAKVVNTSKIDGMDVDKDDLLMDLARLLPPPHIKGKVTAVRIENNAIVTFFGNEAARSSVPVEKDNYMAFSGNSVRFGKLIMENTDLTVLDLDPRDPLDWNQDRYKDQLEAGYSKITSNFGLHAYAKDFAKLSRSSSAQPPATPIN